MRAVVSKSENRAPFPSLVTDSICEPEWVTSLCQPLFALLWNAELFFHLLSQKIEWLKKKNSYEAPLRKGWGLGGSKAQDICRHGGQVWLVLLLTSEVHGEDVSIEQDKQMLSQRAWVLGIWTGNPDQNSRSPSSPQRVIRLMQEVNHHTQDLSWRPKPPNMSLCKGKG